MAIHAGVVLALLILSLLPHKFHFEQSALIELQGITAVAGNTGSGAAGAVKTAALVQTQPKAPKVTSLKSSAKTTAAQSATKSQNVFEKISVKSTGMPVKNAEIRDTIPISKSKLGHVPNFPNSPNSRVDLKNRILQKLQSLPDATTSAVAGPATPGVAGIGTDVPFPFAGYLSDVRDRITELWEEPGMLASQTQGSQATIVFRIHRDGSITNVLLAIPSGITALDKSALEAVTAASPLLSLPADFKNDFLDVHLQFDLTR